MQKALGTYSIDQSDVKTIYTGYFVNIEEHIEPHVVIGVDSDLDIELLEFEILKLLKRRFRSFVPFEIFKAKDQPEFFERLVEQGTEIIPR